MGVCVIGVIVGPQSTRSAYGTKAQLKSALFQPIRQFQYNLLERTKMLALVQCMCTASTIVLAEGAGCQRVDY